MDLFDDLLWRALAYQWTGGDALADLLRAEPLTLYCGFDPTADSLHIGSLVQLTLLRRFQRAGHRPIAVAGGATGMVGDPSDRTEERAFQSPEQVEQNLAGIRQQIERFLDFHAGGRSAVLVNNADWLEPLTFIDFVRDVGRHFPVNVMLAKDSVKARLQSEGGLSFMEFSYMLMQAFDFVHLYDTCGCRLQVGGSDQFGNITAGVDLARRMRGVQLFGLTTPLITRADGEKFGKTATGENVWLSADRTSPYAFYQFWINTADADATRYLRTFTDLSPEEIEGLEKETETSPERREAQKSLARELTLLVHGEDGFAAAERATSALFGGDLSGLTERELLEIFAHVPSKELPRARIGTLTAADALVEVGLARSKGEARRLIASGGAYLNSRRLESEEAVLSSADLASESVIVLRAGKKSFALLRFRG